MTSNPLPLIRGAARALQLHPRSGTFSTHKRTFSTFRDPSSSSLKNTGSVARDHLANERTFLAWLRTGLSLIGFGVGLQEYLDHAIETKGDLNPADAQFEYFHRVLPGAGLVTSGGVMVCFAGLRYFRVKDHLEKDLFPPAKRGITVLTVGASCFALVALTMVVSPGSLKQKVTESAVPVAPLNPTSDPAK